MLMLMMLDARFTVDGFWWIRWMKSNFRNSFSNIFLHSSPDWKLIGSIKNIRPGNGYHALNIERWMLNVESAFVHLRISHSIIRFTVYYLTFKFRIRKFWRLEHIRNSNVRIIILWMFHVLIAISWKRLNSYWMQWEW